MSSNSRTELDLDELESWMDKEGNSHECEWIDGIPDSDLQNKIWDLIEEVKETRRERDNYKAILDNLGAAI